MIYTYTKDDRGILRMIEAYASEECTILTTIILKGQSMHTKYYDQFDIPLEDANIMVMIL